jgi:hypothetical protein
MTSFSHWSPTEGASQISNLRLHTTGGQNIPKLETVLGKRRLSIGCPGQYFAILLVASTLAVAWFSSDVTLGEATRFIAFEVLYTLLPGCLLYVLLSPRLEGWLRTVAIGWPCGYAIEVGWFALTAGLHAREAFAFLPLAAVAAMGPFLYRRMRKYSATRKRRSDDPSGASLLRGRGLDSLIVGIAIAAAIVLLTFTFYARSPLPAHARSVVYSSDNVFDISLAAEARHHWPITEPWVAGQPLHYYTGVFIHIAAINQVTGVALSSVVLRLLPSVMFLLTALQLWSLGRSLGRSRWVGPLAVVLLLVVADLNMDPAHTEVFHINPFTQFSLSPSFAFGVPFFLALLALVQSRFLGNEIGDPHTERGSRGSARTDTNRALIILAVLILGCATAKTFAAADFIGGLGLFWLWCLGTGRAARLLFYCLVVSVICVGAVYFLMLAGGTASTLVIQPFNFVTSGATLARVKSIVKSFTGYSSLWILAPLVGAPVIAVCLFAPLLGVGWLLRRHHHISPSMVLLLCMFVTGSIAYIMLGAPGGVEGVFLVYGYIAIVPVAALGIVNLWGDTPKSAQRKMVVAGGTVLALGLALAGSTQVLTLTGTARYVWYLFAYGLVASAVVIFAWKYARLFAPTVLSKFWRVVGCCILLLGTLGLVKPITLTALGAWETIRHERIAIADSAEYYGMTAPLYRGLIWVRRHTTACDVLAVNNHLFSPGTDKSIYFYYSAFTERRIFLESWYYTPNGARVAQPYPARFKLNTEAVAHGNPAALRKLGEAGVSYVLIDKIHGTGAPEPASAARLVFSNSALDVYRLSARGSAAGVKQACGTVT